jgi:hypothetical protein
MQEKGGPPVGLVHNGPRPVVALGRVMKVLAVEWSRAGEATGHRVGRIVEPESDMESVCRCQTHDRIESEDLVKQNRLDLDRSSAIRTDVDVGLIPGEPEIGEAWVWRSVGQLVTLLDRKKVKIQAWLEPTQ